MLTMPFCIGDVGYQDIIRGGKLANDCIFAKDAYDPQKELLGKGSARFPYHICYAHQMRFIGDTGLNPDHSLDKHYAIFYDIDMADMSDTTENNYRFTSQFSQPLRPIHGVFTGGFHGNGFTIKNLDINVEGANAGLFRELGVGSVIHDLHLENVNIKGHGRVGALAALSRGNIVSVTVEGNVSGGDSQDIVGGLVGVLSGGSVESSTAKVEVAAGGSSDIVGGLVGFQIGGRISTSQAEGSASGGGGRDYIGGLSQACRQEAV